jgi:hypothetical protein
VSKVWTGSTWTVGWTKCRITQIKRRIPADPAPHNTAVHGSIDCTIIEEIDWVLADHEEKGQPASITNLERFVIDAGSGSGILRLRRKIPLLFFEIGEEEPGVAGVAGVAGVLGVLECLSA